LAIAWRAAQRGVRVTVADPDPGQGATHAAAGMLTPVTEAAYAEHEIFALGSESLRRYPAFVAELEQATGLPTGFRQTGTLQVAYDADDLAILDELRALQDSLGVATRPLSARECREAEPMLDPSVRGGLLAANDGSVDPRLLATALLSAAAAAGATHVPTLVSEILLDASGAVAGVRLEDGRELSAAQVVLAAGWQSAGLAGLPATQTPPVRPVKGQIIRLRTTPADAAAGLVPGLLQRTVRGIVQGSTVYLVPRESGELVIGATQEEMGADTTVTAGGIWGLLRDARMLVPGITELAFTDVVAGLRPGTPDNAPVLGPGRQPGLVLATGHFRAGVLLAPVTADTVTQYLLTGEGDPLWKGFAPSRFGPAPGKAGAAVAAGLAGTAGTAGAAVAARGAGLGGQA
jgi:glycine oxidase